MVGELSSHAEFGQVTSADLFPFYCVCTVKVTGAPPVDHRRGYLLQAIFFLGCLITSESHSQSHCRH
ncbi:uncharacterized protein LAJ45_04050 [Morchella importuna]|uniref:uncharacterized protein n=1 Tax=Morchella importuna TaxID=1174673 RepID=UPI001E8DA35C|nr:uncharacterized protein LAJ45_04050 [Morchella importuna]KAH8152056.1 hypothetical protein LAJ45_04050 [Morchella importuna]